jgi:rhomboid protease GluP
MFRRQRSGSVLCRACGKLVGVHDEVCLNCGQKNPGLWGFAPFFRHLGNDFSFTLIVIWGCVFLYVATLLADPSGIRMSGLSILAPSTKSLFLFGASGAIPIFGYGRWWTVLSAAWLHGGLIHIGFNLLWVRQLAPDVSALYGGARGFIIYTAASITGFFLSSFAGLFFAVIPISFLRGASLTVGASASIFGLLGALVAYGRRGGNSHISSQASYYAVAMIIFGFLMPGIDNFAHIGGFVGGYATALLFNPFKPEQMKHIVAAILCLVIAAASIFASVFLNARV